MKFGLRLRGNVACICGKCKPEITIEECAKEDFKKLMGWTEQDFLEKTYIIHGE